MDRGQHPAGLKGGGTDLIDLGEMRACEGHGRECGSRNPGQGEPGTGREVLHPSRDLGGKEMNTTVR